MSTTPARAVPALDPSSYSRGFSAVVVAFAVWGLFPIYFKQLQMVPALQIVAHRLVWGCAVGLLWLLARRELQQVRAALLLPRVRWLLCTSATLVSINWGVYVWGVTHGHVIETSLGYYINPLVNVLLGVVVLSERLNRWQWSAVAVATAAVAYLTWTAGQPPWISLVLASSFGTYGLVRKLVKVESTVAFTCETLLLLPFAAGYLLWSEAHGVGSFAHTGVRVATLLLAGGVLTAVPLVLFGFGTLRIPYSTVGVLQFMSLSIQLLLAVFIYHEPFGHVRTIGFTLIWLALLLYASDGLWRARRSSNAVQGMRTAEGQ